MSEVWSSARHRRLVSLVDEGRSATQIARELGVTRNAVLGRAHRNGISLPMTEEKASRIRGGALVAALAGQRRPLPADHPSRRGRKRGSRAFTDQQIAAAIAARLAGLSYVKAAHTIGASAQSLVRNWMPDPELMERGRALYERAQEQARLMAAERERLSRIAAARVAEAAAAVHRQNEPVLAALPRRTRLVIEWRFAGWTLARIGKRLGVTRERVRQLQEKALRAGVKVPPGVRLNQVRG